MRNTWVIVTGASGAGKDYLTRALREHFPDVGKVLTSTTRAPRPGEENGKAYNFYSREEFEDRIARGEFVEWMCVHGSLYGTRYEDLRTAQERHALVISIMDPFGALAIQEKQPQAHTIFIDAPKKVLLQRLRKRGDEREVIATRMRTRRAEIRLKDKFSLYVQNTDFNATFALVVDKIVQWGSSDAHVN